MKMPFFLENLKSNYCKFVFLVSLIVGFAITPKRVFMGKFAFLAYLFVLVFSFTMACFVRSIKEKVKAARSTTHSILGIIASVIGISTLQVCGIGAPICGASIGFGILSAILPAFILNFMRDYAEILLVLSILMQIYALYKMSCLLAKSSCKTRGTLRSK